MKLTTGKLNNNLDQIRNPKLKRDLYTDSSVLNSARKQFFIGVILLGIPLILYLISLIYKPYGVTEMNPLDRFQGPSVKHWFGTDNYGRDVFVRAMSAFPITIFVSLGINFIGCFFGSIIGALSGYFAGVLDYIFSRLTEALLSIPMILMGLLFVSSFGNGVIQVIVALGIMFIPSYARIVRSGFLEYRQRNFVKRLQLLGSSSGRIIFKHLFPLIKSRLLSALALGFSNAILAESSLSFLGLGVPTDQITWGRMLKDAQGFVFQGVSAAIFPGILIVVIVLGSFFVSHSFKLRDQENKL
ncbi:MAG: ABC transporter permease [Clostridiaceae bacterium]|nr:ABC transporter permease [Clostridiaceae bacterium]